ncbi:hypothetical protein PHYPSEUDO_013266 [Phytophthora pseudosyringae]|uniref:Uncharacterized protein n=1 Tax=Phytophthora pseudosyringae TaxID=221518 RepID=A0A8T1W735_9STRA|nr:hypothetical protein PHYPSEUDO_013266 [Phytophthora pseudosyringae]
MMMMMPAFAASPPVPAHSAICHTNHKASLRAMRNLFHRSDKRLSVGSDDGVEIKERRSSVFRRHLRCSEDSEIVELMRPRDTVVTRISGSSESPTEERRRRRRRSLL